MSTTTLGTIAGITLRQEDDNTIKFTAGAQIDADGCNGQSRDAMGMPIWAYHKNDDGLERLANAGYPDGNYQDMLMCDAKGRVIEFKGGYFGSSTAYFWKNKAADDPTRYVDSYSVPYIVVPPMIRYKARGVVLGCMVQLTNTRNKKSVAAVVADIGPHTKIGEISMAAARALGIAWNPIVGGTDDKIVSYEIRPGVAAVVNGVTYDLIPC
jgi:hypothetical protein